MKIEYKLAGLGDLTEIEMIIKMSYKPIADLLPRLPGALVDTYQKLEKTFLSKQLFKVVNREKKLIGTFSLVQIGEANIKLYHLAIKPEFQNQGAGTWIVDEIIKYIILSKPEISTILIEIYALMPQLKRFYEKFGFIQTGTKIIRGVKILILSKDL
jgi:N-acetylglutamate synthase-like GNAT family acetyltransferase